MPVPSTIMEFRLTMVRMPKGRVSSAQAFIIGRGPIAITSSISLCSFKTWSSTTVTKPFVPKEPSSVATRNSSEYFVNRSSQNIRSLFRKPMMEMVKDPSSLCSRSWGNTGATPKPPPTSTAFLRFSICEATPKGPIKSITDEFSGRAII